MLFDRATQERYLFCVRASSWLGSLQGMIEGFRDPNASVPNLHLRHHASEGEPTETVFSYLIKTLQGFL